MRIAVAGSHGTGKSTLISAFVGLRPEYRYEPEAYEMLADDVDPTASEGPSPEGLRTLLDYTMEVLTSHAADACVVFERSPVDYLAYAAASRTTWSAVERREFLRAAVPAVRGALRRLDVIALLTVSKTRPIRGRPGEDERFRKRVDTRLRRALVEDDFDLFDGRDRPRVVELPARPALRIAELMRLTDRPP